MTAPIEKIKARLEEINKEKKILNALMAYYTKDTSLEEVSNLAEVSIVEFKKYQTKHDYPHRLKPIEKLVISPPKRFLERIDSPVKQRLGDLEQIMYISSWSRIIGSKFRVVYLNEPVLEIFQDSVVLLPAYFLTGVEDSLGEPFVLLIGPGIYYVQFRLKPGEIISDYREITGIILLQEQYKKAQNISESEINPSKILMTDEMITIPFSLLLAKQTTQMFLRGVVARNIKKPFDKLFELCRNHYSFLEKEGFPGEYPLTRGVFPTMYRARFWTMRQYAGFATAEQTNQRFKYLLEQGQKGLSVAFDLPT
ncbi:MAG: methylmalonyl-CoA mutase family protein, partial [Candidatus Hodarchaeota archaeon]